jgi:hypothetical protein
LDALLLQQKNEPTASRFALDDFCQKTGHRIAAVYRLASLLIGSEKGLPIAQWRNLFTREKRPKTHIPLQLRRLILIDGKREMPRNAGDSCRVREQSSGLQTEWRSMQSGANPSLPQILANREKYREIGQQNGPDRV